MAENAPAAVARSDRDKRGMKWGMALGISLELWERYLQALRREGKRHPVVPAMDGVNAGNAEAVGSQNGVHQKRNWRRWIPAYAGMTTQ
jgi:hypothetical protein